MRADEITAILAGQHTNDVFVSECKDGPTWFGGHARMDAWAMNRSWSRLCTTGYEIKVSKRDFQQDKKWHTYLPLCNQLYFVCPKGMIDPREIPAGVGLKYCTEKQARTIVKAAHRDVVIPQELFFYILMCRARIVGANHYEEETREQKIERLKKWVKEKVETRDLGYEVGRSVSETFHLVKMENIRLKQENKELAHLKDLAAICGITEWNSEQTKKDRLDAFKKNVPEEFTSSLSQLKNQVENLLEKFGQRP